MYIKGSKESFLILSLYVDDILLAGNDKEIRIITLYLKDNSLNMWDKISDHLML